MPVYIGDCKHDLTVISTKAYHIITSNLLMTSFHLFAISLIQKIGERNPTFIDPWHSEEQDLQKFDHTSNREIFIANSSY